MADRPTHLDANGTAHMVDVSSKPATTRQATAVAFLYFAPSTLAALRNGDSQKGDVLGTARIAGILAAKRTGELIPLCHPLNLSHVGIRFAWLDGADALAIECTARCAGPTGVEMEALTGATLAALTVYDMAKAIDRAVTIGDIHVCAKSGGKSGEWRHPAPPGPSLADAVWS